MANEQIPTAAAAIATALATALTATAATIVPKRREGIPAVGAMYTQLIFPTDGGRSDVGSNGESGVLEDNYDSGGS
jgi:hypothetical protein